jgi:hypothetical protein
MMCNAVGDSPVQTESVDFEWPGKLLPSIRLGVSDKTAVGAWPLARMSIICCDAQFFSAENVVDNNACLRSPLVDSIHEQTVSRRRGETDVPPPK